MKKFLLIVTILVVITGFLIPKTNTKEAAVKFSSWGSQSETQILKELINNFEKETDIKIDFIHIPQNYFQKIHLLFASKLEPDVIFINNHFVKMYIKANLLEDLTPYFKDEINSFYPEAIKCFEEEGKLYAIPRDISNLVIFINKDIFKEHGINPKIKLRNIEELKDLALKLTTKEYYGINTEEDTLSWLDFLASNGGGALSDDGKTLIINNKNSIEALNMYADFSNKYHIAPTKAQIGSMTTAQMFINKKLAMYIGGRWMVPKFRETINFNWDIIEFPSSEQNKTYIDASGWALAKNSRSKENAIKFIKYISSPKSIEKLTKSGLIIPADKNEAQKYILNEQKNSPKNSQIFLSSIKNSKPTPTNEKYETINDILKEKSQSVLNGTIKAEKAFNDKTIHELENLL